MSSDRSLVTRGRLVAKYPLLHGPRQGCVGGYNQRDSGEEVEWRPPLLYANPLGHRVPATLFIARFMRNNMSGEQYKMISKVALGVNRPGTGCTGCVGVNIAYRVRGCEYCLHTTAVQRKGWFLVLCPPPTPTPSPPQGADLFKGYRGQGLHLGAPHGPYVLHHHWPPFGKCSGRPNYHPSY